MKVVFKDPKLGTLSWDVPRDIANYLGSMPPDGREIVVGEITAELGSSANVLAQAVRMGEKMSAAFELAAHHNLNLLEDIAKLSKKPN